MEVISGWSKRLIEHRQRYMPVEWPIASFCTIAWVFIDCWHSWRWDIRLNTTLIWSLYSTSICTLLIMHAAIFKAMVWGFLPAFLATSLNNGSLDASMLQLALKQLQLSRAGMGIGEISQCFISKAKLKKKKSDSQTLCQNSVGNPYSFILKSWGHFYCVGFCCCTILTISLLNCINFAGLQIICKIIPYVTNRLYTILFILVLIAYSVTL